MRLPFAFYGTLRAGGGLSGQLRYLGEYGQRCRIPGALYDVGAFPALVLEDGAAVGQLWTPYVARYAEALRRVDGIEGEGFLYRRERVELIEPEGVAVWTYVWIGRGPLRERVPDDDWLAWVDARREAATSYYERAIER